MSDADVESYKQIKSDLDVLRQSVEKSELWVYKSNKPTTITVGTGSSQQLHNDSDEHQQQTSAFSAQVSTTTTDDTTAVDLTSSTNNTNTIPSQPIIVDGNHVTTQGQPTNTIEKGAYDTFVTDGDGNSNEEEDEDDEYKKIQKVTISFDMSVVK